jgi:hypothetical protein
MANNLQFKTATTVALNGSLSTALGKPSTVLNNQTTTIGMNVGQGIGKHRVSFNVQDSQFKDKNGLAHDLDTLTEGLTASWKLPKNRGVTLGLTETDTKDKTDGSKRTSQSFGPSFSTPLGKDWSGQFWGTYTASKNTSAALPADTKTLALNSEYTLAYNKQTNMTFGVGATNNKDTVNPSNTYNALTASIRLSYTF